MSVRSHLRRVSNREGKQLKDNIAYVRLDDDLAEDLEKLTVELDLDRSKVVRELTKCSVLLYQDGPLESIGVDPKVMEHFRIFLAENHLENIDVVKMLVMLTDQRLKKDKAASKYLDDKKDEVG